MDYDAVLRYNLCQYPNPFYDNPYTSQTYDHEGQLNSLTVEANPNSNFLYSSFDESSDPFQACLDQEYPSSWAQEHAMQNLQVQSRRFMDNIVDTNHSRAPFLTMDQYQMNDDLYYSSKNSPTDEFLEKGSCLIADEDDGNYATKGAKQGVNKRKRVVDNKSEIIKGQWTPEEDGLLVELVEEHGVRKWSSIAQMLPGRIGKQCRERWHNHLKPNIKKDRWSDEEDRILIESHRQLGNRWAEIARSLPGRSENTIKNHWNATKRRQLSSRKNKNNSKSNISSPLQNYIKSLITNSDEHHHHHRKSGGGYLDNSSSTSGSTSSPPSVVVVENGVKLKNENDEGVIINGLISDHQMMHNSFLMDYQMHMQFDLQKEMDFMEMLSYGYI